jgi:Uma2 family endonuclease
MGATVTGYMEAVDHLPPGTTLVAYDVPWEDYERLLEELEDRPGFRVTYDQGRLEIMSPRPKHERYKSFLDRMIIAVADYLDVNVEPCGSTTWKKEQDGKGTEPDNCYYVANADRVIDHDDIDLNVDPPPDLAVEIEATNESRSKFPIYASLRVPEIWRVSVQRNQVQMYGLHGNEYVEVSASLSFPVLTPEVLAEFLRQRKMRGQKAAMADFRAWLQKQTK